MFRTPLWRTALWLAALWLFAGCARTVGSAGGSGAAPAPPPQPTQPTATVTRGSITDQVQSTGQVVAVQQQALYFRQSGTLDNIFVHIKDQVKRGQVLAALDVAALQKQIAQQQAAVDAADLNLQKDRELLNAGTEPASGNSNSAAAAANGSASSRRAVVRPEDIASADAAVQAAQAVYAAAQSQLAALTTPNADDVKQAQGNVTSATARLASAKLALQALQAGPSGADRQQANAAVISARSKLNSAAQALAALQAGPSADERALADANLEDAQQQFNAAQAIYQAFLQGPTPTSRQQAALAVTQAKNALYTAQVKRDSLCSRAGQTTSQAQCNASNASVATANADLQSAQQNLAHLADVRPADKLAAEAAYQKAQADLAAAQAQHRLTLEGTGAATSAGGSSAGKGGSPGASSSGGRGSRAVQLAEAQAAVTQAQAALNATQASAAALGPTALAVAQAQQIVTSAQANVDAAQAALDAVAQPDAMAIREAQDTVKEAAAAVVKAEAAAQRDRELAGQGNSAAIDLALDQNAIDQARLHLQALESDVVQTQIVAPFDGQVMLTTGQPGDQIGAFTPVITLANPATLQISVTLSTPDLSRIAIDQKVNIVMDTFAGRNIQGTVTGLPSSVLAASNQDTSSPSARAAQQAAGGGSNASGGAATSVAANDTAVKITPQWPGPGAEIGQTAKVTITASTEDNTLLVPTTAINKSNNRTYVLVDIQGHQQPSDVTVGIQNDQFTEILSGLQAGQRIYLRTV